MDIGAELRHARELRGLTLRQLADLTKISVATLQAIETNELRRLPGGVFTRGFLRAYASEVGLDPIPIVTHYVAQFEPPADTPSPDPAARSMTTVTREWARTNVGWAAIVSDSDGARLLASALALMMVLYFALGRSPGGSSGDRPAARTSDPVALSTDKSIPAETARPGVATTGTDTAPAPAPAVAKPAPAEASPRPGPAALQLDLLPTGPCWISATADGAKVFRRLMQPGERQRIEAQTDLVVRIGDPANLEYNVNGSRGKRLGGSGEATTLHLTRENYRDFVAR